MKRNCFLVILLLLLLFTGCDIETDINPTMGVLTPIHTATPMGELVVKPKEGGTITLGVSAYSTLNPLITDNEDIKYYMSLVYNSIYYLDHQLKEVNGLAASANTIDNGMTWIIKLREDVKWHNGNVFNAADCVYTVNYIKNKGGLYATNIKNVENCILQDEFTFSIKLVKPDLYFLSKLTFPIIPSFATDIGSIPMGTSMYMYKETEGNKITLERNNSYWGDKPYIDTVEIIKYGNERIKNETENDMQILSGESVSRYSNKSGYLSHKYIGRGYTCLIPNLSKNSVLKDVNLRKALFFSIDKANIIKSAVSGYGNVAAWPVIPGTQYYQDGTTSHTKDLEKANMYIQSAGYIKDNDGKWYRREDKDKKYPLTIPCNVMSGNTQMRNCALAIKKQVEETGIIFNIVYNSDKDYEDALTKGTYTIAVVDINVGTWPELEVLFSTRGEMNINGYSNMTLDGLLADMFEHENIALRMAEVKVILDEDLPIIGLYFSQEAIVASEKVLGRMSDVFFWSPFNDFNKLHFLTEGVIS